MNQEQPLTSPNMKTQFKTQRVAVAFVLAIGVTGVQPLTVASVKIGSEQGGGLAAALILEGLIEPWRDLRIGMGVDGVIEDVFVERGQRVKKGDLLARLESSVEKAQLDLARATAQMGAGLEAARARQQLAGIRASRMRELFEQGAVTKEELEQVLYEEELSVLGVREVEEALLMAGLDVKVAEAMLSRRTVRSPVDGVVIELFLSPGELVNRTGSAEIVRIAQAHPLKIDVIAPLSLFRKIKAGQKALVSPQDPIGGIHEATVRVVDPLVDAASGTFRIRLELPNEDLQVPAGVRCRVQFQD